MSDDDESTTTGGGGGHFYYHSGGGANAGGGASNAFRQHLARQLGANDDAPLTKKGDAPTPLSPQRFQVGSSYPNRQAGNDDSTPSHIKISALREQVNRLEDALSSSGGAGGASEVLEGKYMEVVKKNRDITVRYESERARVAKLMKQVAALEERNLRLEQERTVLLPSQQAAGAERGGGLGVHSGGEGCVADDAAAKQLKKDFETQAKSLTLFRKQCDEQKKEIAKMRKILLKELGDEATLFKAQAATGPDEDDNESTTGSIAASTVTARAEGKGAPTWKGRAEQIQMLNMKVKGLQKRLAEVREGGGPQSPQDDEAMSATSFATRRTGAIPLTNRDYDDVHSQMLENKAGLKRQELEEAKGSLKRLEEDLRRERTKSEGLASRMKIVEKDNAALKGNVQTLIGKACNDDALIASYKERLEDLRGENKALLERARESDRKWKEASAAPSCVGVGDAGSRQVDAAMQQGIRKQVAKLEQDNHQLAAELAELRQELLQARAGRPPSGSGAQAVRNQRKKRESKQDDSSDDEQRPAVTKQNSVAAAAASSSGVPDRFAWLTTVTAGGIAPGGSSALLPPPTVSSAVEAVARAADALAAQRETIRYYERKLQQKTPVLDSKPAPDKLLLEENQYLRERIKMLTDQNAREATVIQGNLTQLVQQVIDAIASTTTTSVTLSKQAWDTPSTSSGPSSVPGGFLPTIGKASTPLMNSKGSIRADTEPTPTGRANTADVVLGNSRAGKVGVGNKALGTRKPDEHQVVRGRREVDDEPQPMSYADAQRMVIEARAKKDEEAAAKRRQGRPSVMEGVSKGAATSFASSSLNSPKEDGPVVDSDGEDSTPQSSLVYKAKPTKTQPAKVQQGPQQGARIQQATNASRRQQQPSPPPPQQTATPTNPTPRRNPPQQQPPAFAVIDPSELAAKLSTISSPKVGVRVTDGIPSAARTEQRTGQHVSSTIVSVGAPTRRALTTAESDDDDGRDEAMPTYGDDNSPGGYTPRSEREDYWLGPGSTEPDFDGYVGTPRKKDAPAPNPLRKNQPPAPAVLPAYRPSPQETTTPDPNGYASKARGGSTNARARF